MLRLAALLIALRLAPAASLEALPEFSRPDPFGGVVEVDARSSPWRSVTLAAARGGYASCHLTATHTGPYTLSVELAKPLAAEVYREWFHAYKGAWYPDALFPVSLPYRGRLPDPENRIDRHTVQGFWLDVWVPADTPPGVYRGKTVLEAGGKRSVLPIEIRVTQAVIPAEDVIQMDGNSYGTNWLAAQYPQRDVIDLIRAYHRIFYEHRGIFHQLGYGHGGKVAPEFAPALEGNGRGRHVSDWSVFDRHYGPLADGSAFAGTRRGPRAIPFAYLPVNPEWPASFLGWGEPGYETEFVNVLREMERHFREKGWTHTRFELFFNHKKRYKAFPWDGDETRFPADLPYFREYARLMQKAIPPDSPVKFVFRTDASWMTERQFRDLAGIINFWVCGGTGLAWYRQPAEQVRKRGDLLWIYGGTPELSRPSIDITMDPMKTWMMRTGGFVRWLAVDPGKDPWFHSDGGGTTLVYPGPNGPLASVRLKLQRNVVQDIDLLEAAGIRRDEAARRYNGSREDDWWTARPKFADTPPEEWSNATFEDAPKPKLGPASWERVREMVR